MSIDRVFRVVFHELVHRVERLRSDAEDAVLDTDAEVFVPIGRLQRDRETTDLEKVNGRTIKVYVKHEG